MIENKRFTDRGLGNLRYFNQKSDLGISDRKKIKEFYAYRIFSENAGLGYFKIRTKKYQLLLQPFMLQAIEYSLAELQYALDSTDDDICNYYSNHNLCSQLPKHGDTLFRWGENISRNNRFVVDFIFNKCKLKQNCFCDSNLMPLHGISDSNIILKLHFITETKDPIMNTNFCILDGPSFIQFMKDECPFVGAYSNGLLNIHV